MTDIRELRTLQTAARAKGYVVTFFIDAAGHLDAVYLGNCRRPRITDPLSFAEYMRPICRQAAS